MHKTICHVAVATIALVLAGLTARHAVADNAQSPAERGRYLTIAGNCITCHTSEGGELFAGGLAFQTPFGTIYSTNITPHRETGIGSWSEAQFARAVREGVRPDGEHLYPAFPYTAYTKLSDDDVASIYAYLQTLKPVDAPARQNEMGFPYNQRWALGGWKMLFFDEGRFEPDSSKSKEWNRGAYLVEGLGHCSACHSPRNLLGAEKSGSAMTGGELTAMVANGAIRTWSTPNLTDVSNGLQSWSLDDVADYLKHGRNSATETHGPMNEVILSSTRHLTDADVRAMAVYLKELPGDRGSLGKAASAEVLKEGERLYNLNCGTCHQPNGMGDNAHDGGARLVGNPLVQATNPAALINVVLYGPQVTDLGEKRGKDMPSFEDKLADEDIAAIASYLRNAWGNVGGEVTEEQVTRQR